MQFRNSFEVQAQPERVYAFLLDVSEVISCVPGASLTEVIDNDTYHGKMKIKLGAISMSYDGKATIIERDPAQQSAILRAEARETSGGGSAAMQAELRVSPAAGGSAVSIVTDLNITGRAAQFGRGIMEDVSKRMIDQMAASIKAKLELPDQTGGDAGSPAPAAAAPPAAQNAAPVNVLTLLLSVLRGRIARLFRRREHSSALDRPNETEPHA